MLSRTPSSASLFLRLLPLLPTLAFASGCAGTKSFVHAPDTTLGRVVVYRNGIAYFERTADVVGDHLTLKVPAERVDDFLKSLTVVDAKTGQPAPISYPTRAPSTDTGLLDMNIGLQPGASHTLKLSYVTESPSWKPSYRVVLGKSGKVELEAWAIVDNTSGEDWKDVRLGVGSSSALSFRFDLQSVRLVERETLHQNDLFAVAPPMGGATYGTEGLQKKLVAELDDNALAMASAPPPPPVAPVAAQLSPPKSGRASAPRAGAGHAGGGALAGPGAWRAPSAVMDPEPADEAMGNARANDGIRRMVQSLKGSQAHVVVEGFARSDDKDQQAASLERANKLREELVRNGVSPSQVVAVGRGVQAGKNGGARVVEAPLAATVIQAKAGAKAEAAAGGEPIGTSNFESGNVTSVNRGMSAMVSILKRETDGEVVYLYDPESSRGNGRFPFRSVHMKNPSDSALETGPVTVFGDGHFIGEGMAEPIPAHGSAFVPFALDRQILVDQGTAETDEIARILTVQRGVFSTEVQHKRKTTFTLTNRLDDRATVYVRHTVPEGYKLVSSPPGSGDEKLGSANLFRMVIEPHAKAEVAIEEVTPVYKTIDVRTPESIEQVRVFLSRAAAAPLRTQVDSLLKLNKDMADIDQHITTTREQMAEYRERMNELHEQIFTLKAVRTAGPLMHSLEAKMQEISDKLSKATIDIVALEEKRMVARVHFQDGVADLTLEKPEEKTAAN
jgi:outer membrane protein OmpA-like peptidoglycan-associated protein